MPNEPLPDGIAEGVRAYMLVNHNVSGVGSYQTAHRVTVVRITATQIRVTPAGVDPASNMTTVRRRDLRVSGSGGRYCVEDRLAPADDPKVRKALFVARAVAALPNASRLQGLVRVVDRVSPVYVAKEGEEAVDRALAALAELRDLAAEAHSRLSAERGTLS